MKNWKYALLSGTQLRKAIHENNTIEALNSLKTCYKELLGITSNNFDYNIIKANISEIENQLDILDIDNCDNYEDVNCLLGAFYDFCDAHDIWVDTGVK